MRWWNMRSGRRSASSGRNCCIATARFSTPACSLSSNGIGRHAFRFAAKDDPCYFGLALTQRNVMAVTGACMLVRRETFERLGRFDEAHQIVNNDLDFCLRAHRAGLLTVYTPYATLTHYELASRAKHEGRV